jgi:hypothetical protein
MAVRLGLWSKGHDTLHTAGAVAAHSTHISAASTSPVLLLLLSQLRLLSIRVNSGGHHHINSQSITSHTASAAATTAFTTHQVAALAVSCSQCSSMLKHEH